MPSDDLAKSALRRHVKAVLETFDLTDAEGAQLLRRLADSLEPEALDAPPPEPAAPVLVTPPPPEPAPEPEPEPEPIVLAPPEPALDDEDEDEDELDALLNDDDDALDSLFDAMQSDDDKPALPVRAHRRFPVDAPVSLHFAGRDDLKDVWMRDISKGGLFIEVDEPPEMHTELEIELETPDGKIKLRASVVHVVTPDRANALGSQPGVGVQFTDLDDDTRSAVELYVMGIEQRLQREEAAANAEVEAGEARAFLTRLRDGDVYSALQLAPTSPTAAILETIDALEGRFSAEATDAADAARLQSARAALKRFRQVFSGPARRLAYDFTHGHVRAEARLLDTDPKLLRGVWARVFPEQAEKAAKAARAAKASAEAGDFETAVAHASASLVADPFQRNLRRSFDHWRGISDLRRRMREDEEPLSLRVLGEGMGLELEALREMWGQLHPERVEEAKTLAKHALQAHSLQRVEEAIRAAEKAWSNDPFNADLEEAIAQWRAQLAG